jgi:hypothetical protein
MTHELPAMLANGKVNDMQNQTADRQGEKHTRFHHPIESQESEQQRPPVAEISERNSDASVNAVGTVSNTAGAQNEGLGVSVSTDFRHRKSLPRTVMD